MESFALDIDCLSSELYLSLGLKQFGKGSRGFPRVLSMLSSLLERSVQKNEKLLEATEIKDAITIFHGSRAPTLSIHKYIDRIFEYACCSPSCFVIAKIYVDRFLQCGESNLTSLNVHRLLITSVMLAAKFTDDAFFNNAYYAKVGGISTSELNSLEMNFLFTIDFRLQVSVDTFARYCFHLEKEATETLPVGRPIKSCGIEESWPNKDDPNCTSTVAS